VNENQTQTNTYVLKVDLSKTDIISFEQTLTGYITFDDGNVENATKYMSYTFNSETKELMFTLRAPQSKTKTRTSPTRYMFTVYIRDQEDCYYPACSEQY